MKKIVLIFLTINIFLFSLPIVISAEEIDKYANPSPVVSSGSFICKTWGGTKMDSFNVVGGSLKNADFTLVQGSVIYNLSGICDIGETVSLEITGSQWDMNGYAVGLDNNQVIVNISFLNKNGDEIDKILKYDSGASKSASLSGALTGTVPENTASVIMDGTFSCTWSSANSKATETVGIHVTLTVGSEAGSETTSPTQKPTTTQSTSQKPKVSIATSKKEDYYRIVRFGDLHGEVLVLRAGAEDIDEAFIAEFDTELRHGDTIITKSRSGAILSFSDLSSFEIKEDSKIILDIAIERESKISLVAGNVWVNLKRMIKDGSMEVEMSQAVAGIKGTILAATATDKRSEVFLFTSVAEVTSKATGEKIILKPGQVAITDNNGEITINEFDIEAEAKKFGISMEDLSTGRNKSHNTGWILWVVIFMIAVVLGIIIIITSSQKRQGKISANQASAKKLQASSSDSLNQQPQNVKSFCGDCGFLVKTGQLFCKECGKQI